MTKYIVTALDRSGMGHPSYSTPGRAWPSGQPVEVEVLDQEDCPQLIRMVDNQKRPYPDPVRIGQRAWKRICSDKMLSIRPAGENATDIQVVMAKLVDAEKKATEAEARATVAERKLQQLEKDGPASAVKAQEEILRLQDVVEKAKAQVDEANDKAAKAQAESAELTKQLEQLTAPTSTGESGKKGKRP
jgi:hypothetical protein